jgi:hypothetical protein
LDIGDAFRQGRTMTSNLLLELSRLFEAEANESDDLAEQVHLDIMSLKALALAGEIRRDESVRSEPVVSAAPAGERYASLRQRALRLEIPRSFASFWQKHVRAEPAHQRLNHSGARA